MDQFYQKEKVMTKQNFKMAVIFILLVNFITASRALAAEPYQWKFVGNEDGCQVYTSPVSGKNYIAAKASCVIPARMEVIGTILRDVAGYPQWMFDCKETKVLKVVDDENDAFVFWIHQHVMLFSDRDMVLKSKTTNKSDKGQYLIYTESTRDVSYDAGKSYVRMPSFAALFTLEWVDREHTRVTYMIDPDLGEGLPYSAANSMIKTNPLKTLKNMAKVAKLDKYIESAKKSKYNKLAEDYVKAGHQ